MKKVCYLLVLIGLCAGCNYPELSREELKELTTNLSIDENEAIIGFISMAANYTIDITSNREWTATVSDEATWCTINPTSGYRKGTITVYVAENTTTSDRSATITVTAARAYTQTVTVWQAYPIDQPEMVTVAGGSTTLNGTSVTLSSFQIGQYEVTQKLWKDVMWSWPNYWNSSYGSGDNYPIYHVGFNEVQTFLTSLNIQTGKNYRLPTEAEWEYAAKGGQSTHNYKYSGSNTIGDVAWYSDNSGKTTHPVGTKAPNELGIYDMCGNLSEWCSDWRGDYPSSTNNPTGATAAPDSARVVRGGDWSAGASSCLVSQRNGAIGFTTSGTRNIGFRLAHDVE